MDLPQIIALGLAIASTVVGVAGLADTRPLPPSARLGAFAPLDTSKDGRISQAEWLAAGRKPAAMAALDKNKDGVLTPDEVKRRAGGRPSE